MAASDIARSVLEALEESASQQGLDIVDVELAGPGSRPVLRVRIDVLDGGTIDMDRVAEATPWVSEVVEALDLISGPYDLEVSSPGVDRPLRRASDFERFIGERAEVRLSGEVDGRKTWSGTIAAVEGSIVTMECDGAAHAFDAGNVVKAKLKPDFEQLLAAAKKAAKQRQEAFVDFDDDADEEDE